MWSFLESTWTFVNNSSLGTRRVAGSQAAADPAETEAAGSSGGRAGGAQGGEEGAPGHQGQQEQARGAAPRPDKGSPGSTRKSPSTWVPLIPPPPLLLAICSSALLLQAAERRAREEQVKLGEEAEAKLSMQVTALNENVATLKREWQSSQRRVGELEKQTDELRGEIAVLEATVQNNQDERRALLERSVTKKVVLVRLW